MPDENDVTTLVWGHRTDRPDPRAWAVPGPATRRSAARWESLRQAINYAVGMREDRAAEGLHPWIRTPQGHVYSPVTIEVMASVMHEGQGSRPLDRPGAPSPPRSAAPPV